MNLDQFLTQSPRALLVISVLVVSLILIIYNNPMEDGCKVEVQKFMQATQGVLFPYQDSKKRVHFAMLNQHQQICQNGNNEALCRSYFNSLKKMSDALLVYPPRCHERLVLNIPTLASTLSQGLKIMALAAWGDGPREALTERKGWLQDVDLLTFCRLKARLSEIAGEGALISMRNQAYAEFPDYWDEKIDIEQRAELDRPKALKSAQNPNGKFDSEKVFEKSIFSIPCEK